MVAARQRWQQLEIAPDEGFLLCAAPAFNLTFDFDGVGNPSEVLRVNQFHRSVAGSITAKSSGLMLRDPTV